MSGGDLAVCIDTFRLLSELDAAGCTNADVARSIDVSASTVARWKQGLMPRADDWERLKALHARRVSSQQR